MKKYIFIALAAIAALSSCSKESLVSNEENGKEAQVFTATMEDGIATKVTFDGTNKCAFWEVNDEISIDGHTYKATSAGASSTFTGEGATETTHHAYFPANLYNGGTPILPAEQTYAEGKFNMPMYAENSDLVLSFKNLCAVLAITVNKSNLVSTTTTSLKSIKVSSDKRMHGAFTATPAGVLSFTSQSEPTADEKSVILKISESEGVDISTDKTFYIAIPAQDYSYLKIYLSADGSTYKEAMITQKAAGLGTIARSTMFNITYKTNAAKLTASGPYWATMNLGATTVAESAETCYGDYYAWGETEPYYETRTWNGTKWLLNTWKADKGSGYAWQSYCGQSSFLEWNPTPYDNSSKKLTGTYDAATVNWGKAWRMPTGGATSGEFKDMIDNTSQSNVETEVKKGREFKGKNSYSDITLFFPKVGRCVNKEHYNTGDNGNGYYWSSTSTTQDKARYMTFHQAGAFCNGELDRCQGYSVRPVSD